MECDSTGGAHRPPLAPSCHCVLNPASPEDHASPQDPASPPPRGPCFSRGPRLQGSVHSGAVFRGFRIPAFKSHGFQVGSEGGNVGVILVGVARGLASGLCSFGLGSWGRKVAKGMREPPGPLGSPGTTAGQLPLRGSLLSHRDPASPKAPAWPPSPSVTLNSHSTAGCALTSPGSETPGPPRSPGPCARPYAGLPCACPRALACAVPPTAGLSPDFCLAGSVFPSGATAFQSLLPGPPPPAQGWLVYLLFALQR